MTSTRRIPLWVKWAYTAFMAVLVPVYWYHYGPTNFLYFCDIALLLTLAGVWLESPLLVSLPTVGILIPQLIWCADFLGCLIGHPISGSTAYMFHEHKPLYLRLLSSFHGWLPFFLLWLVGRLGYDRRAFVGWILLSWVVLAISYVYLPPPPAPSDTPNLPVNVNNVYGMSDERPQEWMAPELWLLFLSVSWPIGFFLPVHLVMSRWRGLPRAGRRQGEASGP